MSCTSFFGSLHIRTASAVHSALQIGSGLKLNFRGMVIEDC